MAASEEVAQIKSGGAETGARAAMSHTSALAGTEALNDALFRRLGIVRVASDVKPRIDPDKSATRMSTMSRAAAAPGSRRSFSAPPGGSELGAARGGP